MDKHAWWAWAIKNSVCLICWTVLATVFNDWTIALVAILFMSSLKTKPIHKYYRVCDNCGEHSEYTDTKDKALEKAKEAGWIHCPEVDKDYCPECLKKGLRYER